MSMSECWGETGGKEKCVSQKSNLKLEIMQMPGDTVCKFGGKKSYVRILTSK